MTLPEMHYTNLFGNKGNGLGYVLKIDGDCTITNYEDENNKPSASIKVECKNNSIFIEEGSSKYQNPDNVADFSEKKADILREIASMDGDDDTLSIKDLRRINTFNLKNKFNVNITCENDVLLIKWGENDILKIDFSKKKETKTSNIPADKIEEIKLPAEPIAGNTLVHTVLKGETIYSIAKQYKVTIQDIKNANPNLNVDKIRDEQKINIPNATSTTGTENTSTEKVSRNSIDGDVYIVKKGDTLTDIAKANNLFAWEVRRANPEIKDWRKLQIKQKVIIPEPTSLATLEDLSETEKKFLDTLQYEESRGEENPYKCKNWAGYMGAYQIGYEALNALNVCNGKNWIPNNRFGLKSEEDFLNSPEKQLQVAVANMQNNWNYLTVDNELQFNVEQYIGKNITYKNKTYKITTSGVLAAAHLLGPDKVITFLKNPNTKEKMTDGNGTHITKYLQIEGYDLSSILDIS